MRCDQSQKLNELFNRDSSEGIDSVKQLARKIVEDNLELRWPLRSGPASFGDHRLDNLVGPQRAAESPQDSEKDTQNGGEQVKLTFVFLPP